MVVFLPGFFVVIGALVGMFLFKNYFEAFAILILLDGLYSLADSTPHTGVYTIIGVVSFVVSKYLKKHLAWYS